MAKLPQRHLVAGRRLSQSELGGASRQQMEPVASHAVEWDAKVRASYARENRCSCLQKTLRSPLVSVWTRRYPVAQGVTQIRSQRVSVSPAAHLELDHSSDLFAGARQSFRTQAKTSLRVARLCIVIAVSEGSCKDRK
jgi:hypothetical protein